jgi:hypothetical protein
LNATQDELQRLSKAKDTDWHHTRTRPATKTRPTSIRFQERLDDEYFETEFDFIQTFRIGPKGEGKKKEYRRSTIACMEYEGVPYFAKNGKHYDTADGFIQGTYWANNAYMLVKQLEFTREASWCQHTEPQLMALYVERYLHGNNLRIKYFGDSSKITLDKARDYPLVVPIYVSRDICGICMKLASLVNKTSRKYVFEFSLDDVSSEEEASKKPKWMYQ